MKKKNIIIGIIVLIVVSIASFCYYWFCTYKTEYYRVSITYPIVSVDLEEYMDDSLMYSQNQEEVKMDSIIIEANKNIIEKYEKDPNDAANNIIFEAVKRQLARTVYIVKIKSKRCFNKKAAKDLLENSFSGDDYYYEDLIKRYGLKINIYGVH